MKRRRDGYRVSNLDYHHFMLPYIKKDRCDSDVYSVYKFDMTNVVKYLKNKRENDKERHLTYFHIFVTVVGKYLYISSSFFICIYIPHILFLYKKETYIINICFFFLFRT